MAFDPVTCKFFDSDWQIVNQNGDFCGFNGPRGQPIFLAMWDDSNGSNLLAPDGSVATFGADGLFDPMGAYDANTIGAELQLDALYRAIAQGTANQVAIANDNAGTLTWSLPQNIDTAAAVIFGSVTAGIFVSSLALPNITLGAGAGVGATKTVTGTGRHFRVAIVAGTGAAGGTVGANATIFSAVYATLPTVPVATSTPKGGLSSLFQAAAASACQTTNETVNGFLFITGTGSSPGFTSGQTYVYDFFVE